MSLTCFDRRSARPYLLGILVLVLALSSADAAHAQSVSLDLGGEGSLTVRIIQLFMLVTVLSLAPGIAVMVTCFPFMVTVLSILRQGLGVQQAPPNMLIISLALFLTYFVMEPIFSEAWRSGLSPYLDGDVTEEQAFERAMRPFETFMVSRSDPDTEAELIALVPERVREDGSMPLSVLVPSFMLSEITRAFKIGFIIFLPFLIIDLVVASILMSMGMMLVPPPVVALPFKLAFFVLADGWTLIAGTLVSGYSS